MFSTTLNSSGRNPLTGISAVQRLAMRSAQQRPVFSKSGQSSFSRYAALTSLEIVTKNVGIRLGGPTESVQVGASLATQPSRRKATPGWLQGMAERVG